MVGILRERKLCDLPHQVERVGLYPQHRTPWDYCGQGGGGGGGGESKTFCQTLERNLETALCFLGYFTIKNICVLICWPYGEVCLRLAGQVMSHVEDHGDFSP